jgi:hypothetical protein
MFRRTVFAVLAVGLASGIPAAAERLPDKAVKELMVRIDEERDRFEDSLDGELKHTILKGAGSEVDVNRFLDDLQENVDRMKDRFSDKYASSAEVTTVLHQGSAIDRFFSQQKPDFQGASEWNRLRSSLVTLAAVYSTTFPITEGVSARRLNDDEVEDAAKQVAEAADQYKKALDKSLKADATIAQATRQTAVREVDSLAKDAKTLASRVGDGKPASGEAKQVLDRAASIGGAASGMKLLPEARTAWSKMASALDKVAQGFGLPTAR